MFGKFLKKYSFFIGLTLFVVILSRMNLEEIFQNISNIKPVYLITAILLLIPSLIIKTLCWNYIMRRQGIKYDLKDSFLMYCSGLYIGIVTPGRMGEITKALYLKKDGHSMGKSLVGAILDRLSDFAFLLIFTFLGSLFFLNVIYKQILIFLIIILILLVLLFILFKIGLIKFVIKKIFYIFIPQKYQKSWKINFQDFINDLKIYKFKNYLIIFIISALSWFFYYIQMYILSKGINIDLPFLYFAIAITIAGFITLIPISISGIGTRDAALLLLFSPFLIAKEKIIVLSALILSISIIAALVGLICWTIKPIKFKIKP